MPEKVTIPDAAREALVEMVRDAMGWREWDDTEVRQEVDDALAIAAPLIARAARIDEIRAIADWLDAEADRDFLDADSRPYAADRLRERADEMERNV